MDKEVRHFHFIGIGGIGMSGIASLLLECGHRVSGSDVRENQMVCELRAKGAAVFIGHDAHNLRGEPVVVYSSAVKEDNPELTSARDRGLSVIRRAQALALLMEGKSVITVAGSHGKTTTTSLLGHTLIEAGCSPTVVIGGVLRNIGSNACIGEGSCFVAEADESDGSFLNYRPTYSIITNIDEEHLDYYKSFDAQLQAFERYIGQTDSKGALIVCADDRALVRLSRSYSGRVITYGLSPQAQVQARDITLEGLRASFECFWQEESLGRFHLALGGEHNIVNALAVIAYARLAGVDAGRIAAALRSFQGARRRLEVRWVDSQYTLIDDYAHHPTEIRATLAALAAFGGQRKMVLFQPHRYTRTQLLMDQFAACFGDAEHLVVTDIYAASEPPLEGVTAEALMRRIKERMPQSEVFYVPRDAVAAYVRKQMRPGDIVVTMGAGDIVQVQDEIISHLQQSAVGESQGSLAP